MESIFVEQNSWQLFFICFLVLLWKLLRMDNFGDIMFSTDGFVTLLVTLLTIPGLKWESTILKFLAFKIVVRWRNVSVTKNLTQSWLNDLEMLLGSGLELWQYLSWEMVILSRRRCHLDEAEGHLAMGKEREASCFHPKHILPGQPQWSPPSDQTLLITWSTSSLVTASKQVLTKLWFTASAVVSHALVCWLLPAVSSSQLVHPQSGSGRGKYSPTGFATFSESRGLHNTRSHDPGILSLPAQTSQHHRCRCGNTQQGEKDKNMSLKNRDAQIHKYNSRSCANGD